METYSAPLHPQTPLPSPSAGTSRGFVPGVSGSATATPGNLRTSPQDLAGVPKTPAAGRTSDDESSLPANSAEDLSAAADSGVAVHGAFGGASGNSVVQMLAEGGSALQFPGALRTFFAALQRREQEPGNDTVRILQWGDSHTAADMFTGEARARMQGRFGDGGVGFSYAGHPFAGYRILGSGRGQSAGWMTLGTHFTQLGDGLLGLGGVAIESARTGDVASLDAPCLSLDVHYLRQPGGGAVQFADNGFAVQTVSTATNDGSPGLSTGPASSLPRTAPSNTAPDTFQGAGSGSRTAENSETAAEINDAADRGGPYEGQSDRQAATSAGTLHYECPAGSHHFTLTNVSGGPVRLLGTVALQPGITWESIGINGAEAPLLLRWNQPIFRNYLAAAAPQLIVLAYGTNEAAARWTGEEYRAAFARLIDMLHRTAPGASILVLGPGDRSLGYTSYTVVGRGRRARRIAHRFYAPYRGTDRILNAQRDVCRTHDCAFWDWRARQGGFGSVGRWVSTGYAQPDHTHLTGPGYRALADALVADLLSAFSAYQVQSR